MYLPAFPTIAKEFNTTIDNVAPLLTVLNPLDGSNVSNLTNPIEMTFNEQEIKFIEENKKFSSFNEDDLILYYKTSFTYSKSKTKTYEKYYNQFLEWGVDKYLVGNEHRTITREEAKTFVEEKMNIDRNFYLENYCKILCK